MTLGVQKTIQKTSAGEAKVAHDPAPARLPDNFTVDKDARYTGSVIEFNKWRGFGHIAVDQKGVVPGDKVFVHWKNIQSDDRFPRLQQGLQVEFGLMITNDWKGWNRVRCLKAKTLTLPGGGMVNIQDAMDAESMQFVGAQNFRYTGTVKFFDQFRGFGWVTLDEGFAMEDPVPKEIKVEAEHLEIERQLQLEREAIEAQKEMADQEKQLLLEALEEKQKQREQEAQLQEKMLQQLKAMEEKMLVGSQVMEKAMQQEEDLRRAAMEVEEKKREQQRMREELEQQQEEKLELEEKYSSTEEQVQKMTAKLEKLWNRHKQTQEEVQDLQQEFQTEREDMLDTIRDLRKEVKLVCLTIENFIPMEQYQQIVERAHFDESSDEWVISNVDLAGNRIRRRGRMLDDDGRRRPGGDGRDGSPDPVAMMNERPNVYFAYTEDGGAQRAETRPQAKQKNGKSQRVKSAGRPGTASRKGRGVKQQAVGINFVHSPDPIEDVEEAAFPKARGLVRAGYQG